MFYFEEEIFLLELLVHLSSTEYCLTKPESVRSDNMVSLMQSQTTQSTKFWPGGDEPSPQ